MSEELCDSEGGQVRQYLDGGFELIQGAVRARMPSTRRGKFALGAGIGLGGMAAMRGRSSGANGLQGRSSGGMTGM